MPNNIVRVNFDQLDEIANRWHLLASRVYDEYSNIQSKANQLKSGDWVGDSAQKFYDELDTSTLPSMLRLLNSLEQAEITTRMIALTLKGAEIEVANIWKIREESNDFFEAKGQKNLNKSVNDFSDPDYVPVLNDKAKQNLIKWKKYFIDSAKRHNNITGMSDEEFAALVAAIIATERRIGNTYPSTEIFDREYKKAIEAGKKPEEAHKLAMFEAVDYQNRLNRPLAKEL